ncbi:hypothetical protein GCM10007161_20200 [Ignatzschineria indica]|uniref:Na(+)-translocating NADH-quinone reductase subunit E n=1 Tax=Ignatzschineria indica TaxID=472583 RepID=A0A2U2AHZ0_9GAMM|nr:PACE efflux transporter [Ignatzschineria indica]PWD82199.1 Na(+)-translocating NADH-quinone reductase subunit E [Ignatzschineria indica]GGZ88629.1 hypothetical protein GCM10007161_20200 [Ignatzschineria indica]
MTIATVRSLKERFFHALLFEVLAILFTMLIGIFLLHKPVDAMGVVSVLISVTALLLNIVFNWIFDKLFPFVNGERPVSIRILHALSFEATLILFTIPMLAYILSVSLTEAFMIEVGLLIFFLFYTYLYNWSYDQIRKKVVAHYRAKKL